MALANPAYNMDDSEGKDGFGNGQAKGSQFSIDDKSGAGSDLEDQGEREKKPLKYCIWITKRPGLWFGLTLGAQFFFVFLLIVLIALGVDAFPFILDRVPLEIRKDVDYLRGLAWDEKAEDTNIIERFSFAEIQGERTQVIDALSNLFYIKGGNVFTKENLALIQGVESDLFNNKRYQEEFCKLNSTKQCDLPSSVIRYFDGTHASKNPTLFAYNPEFNNLIAVLNEANTNDGTKEGFQTFLGKNSVINATVCTSEITRSILPLGYPLANYSSPDDRESEQEDKVKKFSLNEWESIATRHYNKKVGDMEYYYTSLYMIIAVITRQVIYDQMLAIGSLLFIYIFMVIQTGSFWVTSFSILSILTGFATTSLIYRFIIDFRYFGVFHVLAVFIVLGVGADDIFVFFDTWKATEYKTFPSLAHRVSYAYRKAARAMFFTSITTATAFIVSATSPFLGISSFGVFSGILIMVNYMSVIVYVPTVIVTYHFWWEKNRCCCCCNNSSVVIYDKDEEQVESKKNKRWIVRFFSDYYFRFITHFICRWVILAFFLAVIVFFSFFASKVEVQEEQVKLFKENSNFGKFLALSGSAFKQTDFTVSVLITWGVKEQDLSKCHYADAKCMGRTVWDDSLEMNSEESQQALLDFCHRMRNLNDSIVKDLAIKLDFVTNKPEVDCFIDGMQDFYRKHHTAVDIETGSTPRFENGTKFDVPLTRKQVEVLMDKSPFFYKGPHNHFNISNPDSRYFEVGMSYWLMNGFDLFNRENATQSEDYGEELGEAPDPPHTSTKVIDLFKPLNVSYTYGTRLRYMSILINTTLDANSLGYPTARPIRNAWEDYVTAEMKTMPEPLRGGVQCTPELTVGFNAWHWLKTQERLVRSAVIGIIVGISISFPILVIATHNWIVGIYATLTIVFVTVSVVGFIPLAGWKLGILESLNLVLVVGLSVDYVVHLAEGYSRSLNKKRMERTKDMLEEVGVSVLSGAVTTLGASALLLIAQIIFFYQFGIFIFFTILFSILYALVLFTTSVALAGPQGKTGSLGFCFKKITNCFRRGRSGNIST